MPKTRAALMLLFTALLASLFACNFTPDLFSYASVPTEITVNLSSTATLAPSPAPARLLTICMGQEPASLFLYADGSLAARNISQAIYDGPFDVRDFDLAPVILEKVPALSDGDILIEPISVPAGSLIVDGEGELVNLGEGVVYRPVGCNDASCSQAYAGPEPVGIDQVVVRFKLRPGILWSDGARLTADDSVYSYEVAQSLYPRVRAETVARTASYRALDELTVEWRGLPGYRKADIPGYFFTPLPRHAWGSLPPEELLTAELTNRQPLGWGPYVIDEWTPGDHITLSRNPNYFRLTEGLPAFDRLVFRFVEDKDQALAALQAGECDVLDETTLLESHLPELEQLVQAGKAQLISATGAAWEHLDFGISSVNASLLPFFQHKETRQAIASCIDRQRIVDELFAGKSAVLDSYISPDHPLFNPDVRRYAFDASAGKALLEAAGWLDSDGDPGTPRTAQGVEGVPDGTPLEFTFLTTDEAEKQRAAQIIKESLAQCGVEVDLSSLPWETLYAPGPSGPVFGRNFSLAQFGWMSSLEPPCFLYTTSEIPGSYPQHPKGWGGANASGYSNPDFDRLCQQAMTALPEAPERREAHLQLQRIFTEDLPAIPLFTRPELVTTRPDLCGVILDPSSESALWNLESFNYGEECPD